MIAITIPAYDEQGQIGAVIDDVKKAMTSLSLDYFIHVLDDGSTDATRKIALDRGCIVNSHVTSMGLAQTFKDELKRCLEKGADVIVHIDSDGQYDAGSIPNLLAKLDEGHDLVIGSRFLGGNRFRGSRFKSMGNQMLTGFVCLISGSNCTDVTSGFRAMTKKTAEEVSIISDFTYTYEQYLFSVQKGLSVCEVSIRCNNTRSSHLFKHPLFYGIKALKDIIMHYIIPKIKDWVIRLFTH